MSHLPFVPSDAKNRESHEVHHLSIKCSILLFTVSNCKRGTLMFACSSIEILGMSLLFRWVDSIDIVDHIFSNLTIVRLELTSDYDNQFERFYGISSLWVYRFSQHKSAKLRFFQKKDILILFVKREENQMIKLVFPSGITEVIISRTCN